MRQSVELFVWSCSNRAPGLLRIVMKRKTRKLWDDAAFFAGSPSCVNMRVKGHR